MEDEEPLRIAVLGSGPVGLEAALYGRYLGYIVTLFDDQDVCAALASVETSLGSAFGEHCTPLGLAALNAQSAAYQRPAADQVLSVGQWMAQYCIPMSQTDLVANTLRIGWIVESIDFDADNETYQLIAKPRDAPALTETFDYIIDTRGARLFADGTSSPEFAANQTEDYMLINSGGGTLDYRRATDMIRRAYAKIGERDDLNIYDTLG